MNVYATEYLAEWEVKEEMFSGKDLADLLDSLKVLRERSGTAWVDPTVKIEVHYFEETEAGHFRFPIFKRIVRQHMHPENNLDYLYELV